MSRRSASRSRSRPSVDRRQDVTYRAKPPSSALPVPDGRTGDAGDAAGQSTCAAQLQPRHQPRCSAAASRSVEEVKRLVGGNIVVMLGFGNPALTSLIEEWGGIGLIAVNPGVDIHWGTCTTIWGSPDLKDCRASRGSRWWR